MPDKKRILAWSDSATASTGFGVVSRHILNALHNTGEYEIEQLAINYHGQFVDKELVPWQMIPARMSDPRDPYGNKMFLRSLVDRDYDYVWIVNDTFVVSEVANKVKEVFDKRRSENKKVPIVIYYFPVDCKIIPGMANMLDVADIVVCYTEHGRRETLRAMPQVESKLRKIHHGCDTKTFRPLSQDSINSLKKEYLGLSPETYVVINVNRNSVRKQISRTMLAFKEFRKTVPNSILYLHTMAKDQQIDLLQAVRDIGYSTKNDIIFPVNYSPGAGFPDYVLNNLYNCADIYLSTHLGEGWGLTVTEAMACGVPVVCPDNTSMPEILGNGERGYIYPCTEQIWVDNSGFRPMGLLDDIVSKMLLVYRAGKKQENQKVFAARQWVKQNSWETVNQEWVQLFKEAESIKADQPTPDMGEIL